MPVQISEQGKILVIPEKPLDELKEAGQVVLLPRRIFTSSRQFRLPKKVEVVFCNKSGLTPAEVAEISRALQEQGLRVIGFRVSDKEITS